MAGMYAEAPAAVARVYVRTFRALTVGQASTMALHARGRRVAIGNGYLERVVLLKVTTPDDELAAPRRWLYTNKLVGSIPAELSVMSALPSYAPSACCKNIATVSPLSGRWHPPTP